MARIHRIAPGEENASAIDDAARVLAGGGLVIFPTETVYGIGANARDAAALERLSRLKARPPGKPYSFHIARREDARELVGGPLPEMAERLALRFWPGPLTLVVPGRGEEEVGLRLPDHPVARRLIEKAGVPVVAPSANRSGEPPPVTAAQALAPFQGEVEVVLDSGPADLRKASTVVRIRGRRWEVLREGVISTASISQVLSRVFLFVCTGNSCRSPMAEALLKKLLSEKFETPPERLPNAGFTVLSAGTAAFEGHPASEGAVEAVRRLGGRMEGHICRIVTPGLIDHSHRIYVMTRHHRESILEVMPEARHKVFLLDPSGRDIPDPMGGSPEEYQECAERILKCLAELMEGM